MSAIDSWLEGQSKSRPWLAEQLGVSRATLSRVIAGKQWPGKEFFQRLAEVTGGAVTANDFVGPDETKRLPAVVSGPEGTHAC